MLKNLVISPARLAIIAAAILTVVYNVPLWKFVFNERGVIFTAYIMLVVTCFYSFVLGVLALPRVQKSAIAVLLTVSALVSYFITKYGILVDYEMLRNIAQTDSKEAFDLLGMSFMAWMACFVLLPVMLLWRVKPSYAPVSLGSATRYAALPVLSVLLMAGLVWGNLQQLAPFYRANREVRHMIVPYNAFAAAIKYARIDLVPAQPEQPRISSSAVLAKSAAQKNTRNVVVFVVGETARAANFGLGGYARDNTPHLSVRDDLTYFSDFTSCGTYTAFSLPCMFSALGREDFTLKQFKQNDDLIDLVSKAGVRTIWIDNNSGCKGVCTQSEYIDEADLEKTFPDHCKTGECYDSVLVEALKQALKKEGDLFIVLHQKGSHGPLYYKRVPPEFARFQPACNDEDLSACSTESIVNAYDNTILYTDHVLNGVIDALSQEASATMLYASDHGESLGEKGMYLHGAPYMIAPQEQTHIPAMLWMSAGSKARNGVDINCLHARAKNPLSHDNIFPTLLELNQISTKALRADQSMLEGCRASQVAVGER